LRSNQWMTETILKGLEQALAEIGEDNGRTLLLDKKMRLSIFNELYTNPPS